MKLILVFLLIALYGLGSDSLAQNHPYGRWQHETVNDYGTITRLVYHFKSGGQFTFERSIRSDKKKFTSHIVVDGTWEMAYFEADQRKLLAEYDPILREYYAIDGLKSLQKINVQLVSVVSTVAKYDDGKVEKGEEKALAEAWGNAKFQELIPKQDSNDKITVLSGSDGKFIKMIYQKML